MAKYKHLKLSERIEIYTLLSQGKSIRKIAKELKRDPTTIAKEIKKHLIIKETGSGGRHYNPCKKTTSCKKRNQCDAKYCSHSVPTAAGALRTVKTMKNTVANGTAPPLLL